MKHLLSCILGVAFGIAVSQLSIEAFPFKETTAGTPKDWSHDVSAHADSAMDEDPPSVLPDPPVSPKERRHQKSARALYDYCKRDLAGELHPLEFREMLGSFNKLTEADTKVFVDQYLESLKKGVFDVCALRLAFFSGGQPVADLIRSQLIENRLGPGEAANLKLAIGGLLENCWPLSSLPMDDQLENTRLRWHNSPLPEDRIAAIGLLSVSKDTDAPETLRRILEYEKDPRVQAAALLAVGRKCYSGSIGWVESVQAQFRKRDRSKIADPAFIRALGYALGRLRMQENKRR